MMTIPVIGKSFYLASLPILLLCVFSLLTMLLAVSKRVTAQKVFYFQLVSLLTALSACFICGSETSHLSGTYLSEEIARFGQILILSVAVLLTLLFRESYLKAQYFQGEVSSLFQMSILGMLIMVSSYDFITLFIGLELSSIGIYSLVGYVAPTRPSQEGAIKYFILGSMASAFLLFGMSFLYVSCASLNLSDIIHTAHQTSKPFWFKIGAMFTLFGFGFKLALIPFHTWAPDAYESAPSGITAFMATCVKIMIFTVILRFTQEVSDFVHAWMLPLSIMVGLSILGGNILALVQVSFKRLFAYSSIAHSGYMLMAFCAIANRELPYSAVLFYLVAYCLTTLIAFAVLMWIEDEKHSDIQLDDLRGLVKTNPWAACALAVGMFSLAGMPPTVGFFAKFFVFNSALVSDLYPLVFIGLAGSLISLFYYLRVIVYMFMTEPLSIDQDNLLQVKAPSRVFTAVLFFCLASSLLLGTVMPQWLMNVLKPVAGRFLSLK